MANLVSMVIVFLGAGFVFVALRQPKPTEDTVGPAPPKTDANTAERVPETAP